MTCLRCFAILAILLVPVCAAHVAAAQQYAYLFKGPGQPGDPVVSPDGAYALFASGNWNQELWIESVRTHQRRRVFVPSQPTLSVAWSPDSAAFFVNDRIASTAGVAYLYDAKTLSRFPLLARIAAADPGAARLMAPFGLPDAPRFGANVRVADHSHLYASRWLDAEHVDVYMVGHTNSAGTPEHFRSSQCFSLHYRVSRSGTVQKLGQRIADAGTKACDGIEKQP